ncbi:MAG: hypothetical protein ACE5JP_06125 [Candidatus Bipolaricaulia bacterium]
MSNLAPLTESEVRQFVEDWYRKLDVHAPMSELLAMLADEELEMRFPEGTLYGHAEFGGWYQGSAENSKNYPGVVNIFFDEVHTVKEVAVDISGDQANVKVVVKWEASVWNPPAAKSVRIILDAAQTWVMKRSPETSKPVIVTYIVDDLSYYEGSAKL